MPIKSQKWLFEKWLPRYLPKPSENQSRPKSTLNTVSGATRLNGTDRHRQTFLSSNSTEVDNISPCWDIRWKPNFGPIILGQNHPLISSLVIIIESNQNVQFQTNRQSQSQDLSQKPNFCQSHHSYLLDPWFLRGQRYPHHNLWYPHHAGYPQVLPFIKSVPRTSFRGKVSLYLPLIPGWLSIFSFLRIFIILGGIPSAEMKY